MLDSHIVVVGVESVDEQFGTLLKILYHLINK
jgi:hypothetical protein